MAAVVFKAAIVACMYVAIVHMLSRRYTHHWHHSCKGYADRFFHAATGRGTSLHTVGYRIFTLAINARVIDDVDSSIISLTDIATSSLTSAPVTPTTGSSPSAHILPIVSRNKVQVSADHPFGERSSSKTAAVGELLDLLTGGNHNSSIHQMHDYGSLEVHQQLRVEYLIKYLESVFVPIQTIPFLNLAMVGQWRKVYSNLATPYASTSMQCELYQTIQCKDNEYACEHGVVIDKVAWRYDEYMYDPTSDERSVAFTFLHKGRNTSSNIVKSHGTLSVHSNYSINSKGELDLTLREHVLHAEVLPRDLDQFFVDLQRSIPFDSFDPNATCHRTIVSTIYYPVLFHLPLSSCVRCFSTSTLR